MTEEAPERIWAKPGLPGYITDGAWHGIYDIEYIRADIAAAERIKREARKEALFDAMSVCCRGDIIYADSAAKHINYLISLEDK